MYVECIQLQLSSCGEAFTAIRISRCCSRSWKRSSRAVQKRHVGGHYCMSSTAIGLGPPNDSRISQQHNGIEARPCSNEVYGKEARWRSSSAARIIGGQVSSENCTTETEPCTLGAYLHRFVRAHPQKQRHYCHGKNVAGSFACQWQGS
jgi:hypothetical protein